MPLLANNPKGLAGIDFIQQAYIECLRALAGFLVADTTKVTIMYGCAITYPGSDVSVAEGWVFYNGELYYVPAFTNTFHPGDIVNASINTTLYSGADPTTFSDGSTHNVHQQRQVALSISTEASLGTMPDYSLWLNISTNSTATAATTAVLNTWLLSTYNVFVANYKKWVATLSPSPITVGTTNGPAFLNAWVNDNGVSGGGTPSPLMFYKLQGRVYLWGEIKHTGSVTNSTIFNLPDGYYPAAAEEIFTVPDTTTLVPAGGVGSLPEYTIWITNGGAVTFLGAPSGTFSISLSGINYLSGPPLPDLEAELEM